MRRWPVTWRLYAFPFAFDDTREHAIMTGEEPEGALDHLALATDLSEIVEGSHDGVPGTTGADGTRFLESGDEAGTPPGDRKFRPDVEGLRAVAVLLVVLYHAGVPHLTGGFVGVDVFFVLSGFVITGLLLRERSATGKTGLLAFYGRRSRRILPMATLVIVVTVLASYHWLGFISGGYTASFGKAADLFYANFHLIATGTSYLTAQQPPSPLQNYWSLSVEEQFYVVYPTLFIVAALTVRRFDLRLKLAILLTAGIAGSLFWSIHQSATNSVAAYFSPFTRAWELALGALIAVGSVQLARLPQLFAAVMTWVGLAGILVAAFMFTDATLYPGSAVGLPVISTALVVAGGTSRPAWGGESALAIRPLQWTGRLSYSLYLWHWPILIIAAQHAGHALSVWDNLLWVLLAVMLSVASHLLVENPIRHAKFLSRSGPRSLLLGAGMVGATFGILAAEIAGHP
jgi:peptidoglycan/LPS O-acetylase OafA/YrhL